MGFEPVAAEAGGGTGAIGWRLAALRAWLPRGEGLEREAWERRHRLLLAIVWLHVVLLPVYAATAGPARARHAVRHRLPRVRGAGRQRARPQPPGAGLLRVHGAGHLLRAGGAPVRRAHRGPLPLLRHHRPARPLPGLGRRTCWPWPTSRSSTASSGRTRRRRSTPRPTPGATRGAGRWSTRCSSSPRPAPTSSPGRRTSGSAAACAGPRPRRPPCWPARSSPTASCACSPRRRPWPARPPCTTWQRR